MSIQVFNTSDETLQAVARFFIEKANSAISRTGRFNIALSGGSSPKKLYELLSSDSYNRQTDWSRIYFFFGDERYVPGNDPDYNGLMAKQTLFDPLNIPAAQIFLVDTTLSPELAARQYLNDINNHFNGGAVAFDLILLGLGDNAHTASLFPYTTVLTSATPSVESVFLPDQEVYRITLTAPLINQAHDIAFLVYGKGKAEAVRQILEEDINVQLYPAQLIHPEKGQTTWFLDEAAASLLTKTIS